MNYNINIYMNATIKKNTKQKKKQISSNYKYKIIKRSKINIIQK